MSEELVVVDSEVVSVVVVVAGLAVAVGLVVVGVAVVAAEQPARMTRLPERRNVFKFMKTFKEAIYYVVECSG